MKIKYLPKNNLEKFGLKIYNLLVENFPQTYYVGGMVRDILMRRDVIDIDISTQAKPEQVIKILSGSGVAIDSKFKSFGVIIAKNKNCAVEIATFRKDNYGNSRYPKINFVKTAQQDSQRRDFTINALYLSPKAGNISDFHNGLKDLNSKHIKFIGNPQTKVKEDPLRIIRALRFCLQLHFKFEHKTDIAIEKNFFLLKKITRSRAEAETNKIKDTEKRKILETTLTIAKIA